MSQQSEWENLKERENQEAIDRQFYDEEEPYGPDNELPGMWENADFMGGAVSAHGQQMSYDENREGHNFVGV